MATSKVPAPAAASNGLIDVDVPVQRYMAAAAVLPGGRILVTGGYDRPWTDSRFPAAKASAMIFDPNIGTWTAVASMQVARARHAAVTLSDGRVVVSGGFGQNPLSSVEVYDPRTNTWQFADELSQPRYDHSAVTDGTNIIMIGGSGRTMISSVESMTIAATSRLIP